MPNNGWYTWFAKLIVYGEILVGLALILGAFIGIAAFFGGFMNWNFIMAGAASSNTLLFTLAILTHAGLEGRRMVWPGSLATPADRRPLEKDTANEPTSPPQATPT
ncbi:MAG: hypothetical protein MI924_15260 [Chloroflexales bacterium]|nr:hypothetical protein [Chloroflexales bacterium]